jgi:carboxymethylenebutenolidase
MNRTAIAVTLTSFLVACTQKAEQPAEKPADMPAEGASKAATQPAKAASDDETMMGAVSESEFQKLHELKAEEAPPLKGEMIELDDAAAYLSMPEGADGPVPGVVVIHEWWGLNEHIKHWADRLAALGYAAVAPDLYGGEVATKPDVASKLMKNVDPDRAVSILKTAHTYLRETEKIGAPKVASIGWCFGGGQSLRLAIADPKLDAAVVYYGFPVLKKEKLDAIEADLLLVYANEDESIPPDQVDQLAMLLDEVDVDYDLHRYDAHHAFANPSGAHYNQQAAADAWEKVQAFLETELGND